MLDELDIAIRKSEEVKKNLERVNENFAKFMEMYTKFARAMGYKEERQYCDTFGNIYISTSEHGYTYRLIKFFYVKKTEHKHLFGSTVSKRTIEFMHCTVNADFTFRYSLDAAIEEGSEEYYADLIEAARLMKEAMEEVNNRRLKAIETIKILGDI